MRTRANVSKNKSCDSVFVGHPVVCLWALCVTGQGLRKSFGVFVAYRLLEHSFEAGFVPSAAYLIGSYYRRDQFLRRCAVFFAAAVIAAAFNGFLAALRNAQG